jgi:hypothetical protein
MRGWMVALALALAPVAVSALEPVDALPGWMAGAWERAEGDSWSDEFWTPPRGGMMIGAARIGKGAALEMFEHTRIVCKADGTLSFFAQPRGVPASEFPLVAREAQMVEFANPAHDYPQRVRYWREGPLLKARISLMDGSKAMEWSYKPMGSPE